MVDTKSYILDNEVDDNFSLDDIEDMPGFVMPPTGVYTVVLEKGILDKVINEDNYFEVAMTIKSVDELDDKNLDADETAPKEGDIASTIFGRNNKYAMNNFKASFGRAIAEKFEVKTIGAIKEKSVGLEMMVVIKRTFDKKRERHNIEIKRAVVL